jgi:hypothetical protein
VSPEDKSSSKRRRWILGGVGLAAVGAAALFLALNGSGSSSSAHTAPLFADAPVRGSLAYYGRKSPPPQPTTADGVPALLSSDPGLKAAYLQTLAKRLDPIPRPARVGVFGEVTSVSAHQIALNSAAVQPTAHGTLYSSGRAWAPPHVIARVTNGTLTLLNGPFPSVKPGTTLFVGGQQRGQAFVAEFIADPALMDQPGAQSKLGFASGAPITRRNVARAAAGLRADASVNPRDTSRQHIARLPTPTPVAESASIADPQPLFDPPAPALTSLRQPVVPSPDAGPQTVLASDTSVTTPEDQPNTVDLSGETGILPGPSGTLDPHLKIGPFKKGPCEASATAELLLTNDFEEHWKVQFVPDGNGFVVVSQDQPSKNNSFDVGLSDNPSDYTIYSGLGFVGDLSATAGCHFDVFGVNIGGDFGVDVISIHDAFVEKTTDHIRLAGEKDLFVSPKDNGECFTVGGKFAVLNIGLTGCQYLYLGGGLFRATLTGLNGGQPQGIAADSKHIQVVHNQTDPSGGPVRIDRFNYAPTLSSKVGISPFVDLSFIHTVKVRKSKRGLTPEQVKAGIFLASSRQKNQKGPTLPNGDWQSTNGKWYTKSKVETNPPADLEQAIAQANANWIHPNEDTRKGTLLNGDWRSKADGRWRNAKGQFHEPTAAEQAQVNPLTVESKGRFFEPEPPNWRDISDLIKLDSGPPVAIPPDSYDPSSLILDLPVAAPESPQSTSLIGSFGPSVSHNGGHGVDVTVTDSRYPAGDPTAAGTVQVLAANQVIGSGSVMAGHAHIVTVPGDPGAESVSASYSGDATHEPSKVCLLQGQDGQCPPLTVSQYGEVGPLLLGTSTAADIEAFAGKPQATARGSFETSQYPPYIALGYDCTTAPSPGRQSLEYSGGPPHCTNIYYVSTKSGKFAALWTGSPEFNTPAGTKPGDSIATAAGNEGKPVEHGCLQGIQLGDETTPSIVNIDAGQQTVNDLRVESNANGVGLLFC